MLAYLVKNKDWCNIPDDFINNFKANGEKTGHNGRAGLRARRQGQENAAKAAGHGRRTKPAATA